MDDDLVSAMSSLNLNHRRQSVRHVYQEGYKFDGQSLETEILRDSVDGWKSRKISLFGFCLWLNAYGRIVNSGMFSGRPTISPHGTMRAVLPVCKVFEGRKDYLLPLKRPDYDGSRLEEGGGIPGNWYYEFVYIKNSEIEENDADFDYITRQFLHNWQIQNCHHPISIDDGSLTYDKRIDNKKVWYKILVPYSIDLGAGSGTLWEHKISERGFWHRAREITERGTAGIVKQLDSFK